MASEYELNELAGREHEAEPPSFNGACIVRTAEAILQGEPVPVVGESGRSLTTDRILRTMPGLVESVYIGVQAYAGLLASDRKARLNS